MEQLASLCVISSLKAVQEPLWPLIKVCNEAGPSAESSMAACKLQMHKRRKGKPDLFRKSAKYESYRPFQDEHGHIHILTADPLSCVLPRTLAGIWMCS